MKSDHPAIASGVSVAYVAAEKLVEWSNTFQAFASLLVGILTLAWWIRIWWHAIRNKKPLPGHDD